METPVEEHFPINLQKRVENVLKKEGYSDCEVEKKYEGGNLLSKSYTITIRGQTKNGKKEVFLFVKGYNSLPHVARSFSMSHVFDIEAYMYNELQEKFTELQVEADIPAAERFKIIKSYGECSTDAIILENVSLKGYKSYDNISFSTTSLEVAEMAFERIAKFHAISFVLKVKRPEYYKQNVKKLKYPMTFDGQWLQKASNLARFAAGHLSSATRERLEKFLPKLTFKWKEYLHDQTAAKSCLCHGDFKLPNLMVKHNVDKLEDLYIIDYQFMHVGCPLNDLLYFIFACADQAFRRKYLEYLKNSYYRAFNDFLRKFNLSADVVYRREEFEDDYNKRLDHGLLIALYFLPIFLGGSELYQEISVLRESSCVPIKHEWQKVLKVRLQGIVDDYIEWGYL